jgi:putative restriction endonuclease
MIRESLAARGTELQIRTASFAFLTSLLTRLGGIVRLEDVSRFEYMGERISLLDPQRGIRKPRQLLAALSIRTVHSSDPYARPYADDIGADGYLRYKWRGTDPNHPENRALRDAMTFGLPLIWFQGVGPGIYVPIYPIWMVAEESSRHEFVVALDAIQLEEWKDPGLRRVAEENARYEPDSVNRRLHQPVFRARVILAYQRQCAVCRLRHVELLDAAHIRGDAEGGRPIIPNGIAMCKIHHAAFDTDIIGVRPDYVVQVRQDVLDETDGPVLTHALQELHGARIHVPYSIAVRPDSQLLEERYARFLRAS